MSDALSRCQPVSPRRRAGRRAGNADADHGARRADRIARRRRDLQERPRPHPGAVQRLAPRFQPLYRAIRPADRHSGAGSEEPGARPGRDQLPDRQGIDHHPGARRRTGQAGLFRRGEISRRQVRLDARHGEGADRDHRGQSDDQGDHPAGGAARATGRRGPRVLGRQEGRDRLHRHGDDQAQRFRAEVGRAAGFRPRRPDDQRGVRGAMTPEGDGEGRPGVGRDEAFYDGVIAIIVTIKVLELRPPVAEGLDRLWSLWPEFLAYALRYAYVAIYWVNPHRLFAHATRVTNGLVWSNMLLLFALSLVPFSTSYLGEHHFSREAPWLYLGTMLLPSLAYAWLQNVINRTGKLGRPAEEFYAAATRKGGTATLIYACGVPLTYVSPWLGIACAVVVAILWFLPQSRIDRLFADLG